MHILFVTSLAYLPQSHGGVQSSTNELCVNLGERGHKCAVLAALTPDLILGKLGRIKVKLNKFLFNTKVSRDRVENYKVWRAWFPWEELSYVAMAERPDVIVLIVADEAVRITEAALATDIPILLQLHDVEFQQHSGALPAFETLPSVANSRFTAERYGQKFGATPSVIYPFVSATRYRTPTSRSNVTFINPHPWKGRDIALGVARLCPEIPFNFVESWGLTDDQRTTLMRELAILPNVTFLPPQRDMRQVYAKCKILLAPSLWEEAYGRVATEAQFSGIPVIASSRGGLPEAVGPGGIILDPDQPITDWAEAVRDLWHDERHYSALSDAARAHAGRLEMTLEYQLNAWEQAIFAAATC